MIEPAGHPPTFAVGPDGRTWWERLRVEHALEEISRRARRWHRFKTLPKWARSQAYAEEFARCKGVSEFDHGAFLYWAENYGWVRAEKDSTAPGDLPLVRDMPFMPWDSQREAAVFFLERLRRAQTALCPKSREVGITWEVLHLMWWLWRFWGAAQLCGSRKAHLVDRPGDMKSLFERLRYITQRQPSWIRPRYRATYMHLQDLDNPAATINGESTSFGQFGRGGRYRLIFVDEFGAILPRIAEGILRSTESATGCLILVYNPVGQTHPSYQLFTSLPREAILELRWDADPYRPDDFFEGKILPFGKLRREDAEREWNCSHEEIAEGLIFTWNSSLLYRDDDEDWKAIEADARARWAVVGGWDYGSGKSLTVNVRIIVQIHSDLSITLWVDDCERWNQQHVDVIADEALAMIGRNRGPYIDWGDPAGRQRDALQMGWEAHLRARNINLHSLEAAFNDFEVQEEAIRSAQHMMSNARIRFSAERCDKLVTSLQRWRRSVKEGQRLVDVNGRAIPRKDEPSHAAQAFLYALHGVAKYLSSVVDQLTNREPTKWGGQGSEERVGEKLATFFADRPYGGM